MKKKDYRKTITIISIASILIIAFGAMIFVNEIRKVRRGNQVSLDCFAGAVAKCGNVDSTKEEILNEIKNLDISLDVAKEAILKAQKESKEYNDKLKARENLSEDEKFLLDNNWKREEYFRKALKAIEEKNK